MRSKNSSRKHGKLSFAVDRDEIDINSDWVSAVLRNPSDEPQHVSEPPNNTTVVDSATVASDDAVAPIPTVETLSVRAPVENSATVAKEVTVEESPTVALSDPVVKGATVEVARDEETQVSTGVNPATVAETTTPSFTRQLKPRRIRAIVDGLTPGQFTVYSLMWQRGEPFGEGKRLYAGGYSSLCDLTGMSKRGIQNVVAELQKKAAISIHQAPGYHRTQFSVYCVLSENQILDLWARQGYQFSLGKGKDLSRDGSTVAL